MTCWTPNPRFLEQLAGNGWLVVDVHHTLRLAWLFVPYKFKPTNQFLPLNIQHHLRVIYPWLSLSLFLCVSFTSFSGKLAPLCGSMMRCWRRRKYRRLRSGAANNYYKDNAKTSATKGRHRPKFWKIKVTPKLRLLKVGTPSIMLLRRFRDAYVAMMLSFGGRLMQLNTGNVHLVKKINTSRFSTWLKA